MLAAPDPDDFPLSAEIDAHRLRAGELEREAYRLQAMIASGVAEHDRAVKAEDDAQSVSDGAAALELQLRNEL